MKEPTGPASVDSIEHVISVSWRHRVLFTDGVFNTGNPVLRDLLMSGVATGAGKALFVLDQSLASARPDLEGAITHYGAAHGDRLPLAVSLRVSPGGEAAKNSWNHVLALHSAMDQLGLDRHSFLVAVGGGAFLDMAGLAAATAHRGVRHIRIPTTTLSQCDSGVGIKNAINACGKKNFAGTFCPPFAVVNDFELLDTLPPRHKRAGYAEAVKVACIRDAGFFAWLEQRTAALRAFEPEPMRALIRRCAELHLTHIATAGDPFELGSARPLDFGHWAAHKLEQLAGFRLSHGEAVAIGIALDVIYSRFQGMLQPVESERVLRLLEGLGFRLFAAEALQAGPGGHLALLDGLEEFREHLGGRLTVTLLTDIGSGFEAHEMDANRVLGAIEELRLRDLARNHTPPGR